MPTRATRKPKTAASKSKRSPTIVRELPSTSVAQLPEALAKSVLQQPVNEIAAEVGKKQADLTASDVLLYSTANLPQIYRKAVLDMWTAPLRAWLSMFGALAAQSASRRMDPVK